MEPRSATLRRLSAFLHSMPIYRFNLFSDIRVIDDEGRELPDLAAARAYAIANIRQLASADVLEGRLDLAHRIEILDATGTCRATVAFRDAVHVRVGRNKA